MTRSTVETIHRDRRNASHPRATWWMSPVAACILLLSVSSSADAKEFKFCNNTGSAASDLHIQFTGVPVTWTGSVPPQDPDGTFKDASEPKGTKTVDLAQDLTGNGVANGDCVILEFETAAGHNGVPSVKEARWTNGNTVDPGEEDYLGDPLKPQNKKKGNVWVSAPATGDGVLRVSIDAETADFSPGVGASAATTASDFATFIEVFTFGTVLSVGDADVDYTSEVYGTASNIDVQVIVQDSTQPVTVTTSPFIVPSLPPWAVVLLPAALIAAAFALWRSRTEAEST